jgi:hypothetical protein
MLKAMAGEFPVMKCSKCRFLGARGHIETTKKEEKIFFN